MGETEAVPVGSSSGLRLSELAPRVVQSEIRAMSVECDRMGGVNLAQGICDTDVPEGVAEEAIAAKVHRTLGITVDPEREVLVTSGATGAFHAAAMALLNPGDEVLVFEPFYGYHVNTLS